MVFVAFEGGEGTGKSTQMKRAAQWLQQKGLTTIESREPGGSPLAEKIRTLFKEVPQHGDSPLPMTELMLVMAARAQHFEKTIRPAMNGEKNTWILCDRFLDSTYVYQGCIGGVDKKIIDSVAKLVIGNFTPDLTLVFSVPESVAAKRRHSRLGEQPENDRLDLLHTEVHHKIDAAFRALVEEATAYPSGKAPVRILIDSGADVDEVFQSVKTALSQTFGI